MRAPFLKPGPPGPFPPPGRGFTLVEVLMVLVIFGILAAVTTPSLVRSIRGNRLRAAARTVVMAGRYARSMAVLKQEAMTLVFRMEAGHSEVAVVGGVSRRLDEVLIVYVEDKGGQRFHEGSFSIVYESNGRCDPYVVVLADEQGREFVVEIDSIGSPRVFEEDRR